MMVLPLYRVLLAIFILWMLPFHGAACAEDAAPASSEDLPSPPGLKPSAPVIPGRTKAEAGAIAPAPAANTSKDVTPKKKAPAKASAPVEDMPSFPNPDAPAIRSGEIPEDEPMPTVGSGMPVPGTDVPFGTTSKFPRHRAPQDAGLPLPTVSTSEDEEQKRREDVLVLENGSEWKGYVVSEKTDVVIFDKYSASGGHARFTVPRKKVRTIRRGERLAEAPEGSELLRDSWFLLRGDRGTIGTRHLTVIRVQSPRVNGYRLREVIYEFPQGRHLPAVETEWVEVVDINFFPKLIRFRERAVFEPGHEDADKAFDRRISGVVQDGVWKKYVGVGSDSHEMYVDVPEGVRGRQGHREVMLRRSPRVVGLEEAQVLDPNVDGLAEVRAGFVAVAPRYRPGRKTKSYRGDELHWEQDGARLISRFHDDSRPMREEVTQGVFAVPATEAQCKAAIPGAPSAADGASGELTLPVCGLGFVLPGPLWNWKQRLVPATHTGWRVLGTLSEAVNVADIRVEWHPEGARTERGAVAGEAWLLRRLRGLSPNLTAASPRRLLSSLVASGADDAWRVEVVGRLRGESVHTVVVVVDRAPGRVVLLCACPTAAWERARADIERFIASLRAF